MTRCLHEALARLVVAHRHGSRLALLFDYDGTLTPIVEHPGLAVLSPEIRHRLEQLAEEPSVSVGVLSGRSIEDLRERVGIARAYYAGTSGLELSVGRTALIQPDRAQTSTLVAGVALAVGRTVAKYAGAWVETKPLGISVHYRAVTLDRIAALRADLAEATQPFFGEIRVFDGPMALDITPDLGCTKGTAVRMIVQHLDGTTVLPLYAGDYANDADALCAATELGGVAIGVGPEAPPTAQHRLPDTASLGRCLDLFHQMIVDPDTYRTSSVA